MDYSEFIKQVLHEAGKIAVDKFGKVTVSAKPEDNNQVFTEADLMIGQHIISSIQEVFPTYNIIDEEAGVIDKQSQFTWVIDPIDGTSNFAQGVPTYGIYLGLLKDAEPIAGGLSLPYFNELYIAEKGKGSFCNDKLVSVSQETNIMNSLVAYQVDGNQSSPGATRKELKILGEIILNIRNIRNSGSCFDIAMVANGKYGAILNCTSKIWDNVAAQVIIEEAGGVYTDYFGQPLDYSNPLNRVKDNYTSCAGPAVIHSKLQEIIHQFPQ